MAYRKLSSLDADVTVALGKTDKKTGKAYPKQAEGYYLGKRSVESARGKSNLHVIQFFTEDTVLRNTYKQLNVSLGTNLGIWGTTNLDPQLGRVTPGNIVRITSTGTKHTPKGDMYIYDVEVDESNTITVDTAPSYAPEEDDVADIETQFNTETQPEFDEEAYVAAQAERKARTEALLKGKGKQVTKN